MKVLVEMSVDEFNDYQKFINSDSNKITQQNKDEDEVFWNTWSGWRGNHDQRIEVATCSKCGYKHPTVYRSLSLLSKKCPMCGSKIKRVKYEDDRCEDI